MRTLFFYVVLVFGLSSYVSAQESGQYQYVQVPKEFSFLKHENQYQLNALTAFLFEKNGFKTIYEEQVPANVKPCELLKADVHSDSGLFRSKLYFTLKNCKDEVVFTSKTGVSREKDFEKSYHEALRKAFTSLENFNAEVIVDPVPVASENSQPAEVIVDPVPVSSEDDPDNSEVVVDLVVTSEEMEKAEEKSEDTAAEGASVKFEAGNAFPQLENGGTSYRLKKTPAGFDLYREGQKQKFATLLKSGGGENYLYSSENISGNAFFDTQGNLLVEYLEPNSQQLVIVKYNRKDQ